MDLGKKPLTLLMFASLVNEDVVLPDSGFGVTKQSCDNRVVCTRLVGHNRCKRMANLMRRHRNTGFQRNRAPD